MQPVLDPIGSALEALDAEIVRLLGVRSLLDNARVALGAAPRDLLAGPLPASPAPIRAGLVPPPAPVQPNRPAPAATPPRAARKPSPAPAAAARPAKPAAAATGRHTPGTAPDYQEVARVMRQARDAGLSMRDALSEHFGAPKSTVANWITRVYGLGLVRRPETMPADAAVARVPDEQLTPLKDAVAAAEDGLEPL